MKPLEPLPSHTPVAPTPATSRPPAADRRSSPPVASGRQPAGVSRPPLAATVRFEELARQVVITLIRPDTREVVCQIPPEKILSLIVHLRQASERAFDKHA